MQRKRRLTSCARSRPGDRRHGPTFSISISSRVAHREPDQLASWSPKFTSAEIEGIFATGICWAFFGQLEISVHSAVYPTQRSGPAVLPGVSIVIAPCACRFRDLVRARSVSRRLLVNPRGDMSNKSHEDVRVEECPILGHAS